MKLELEQVNKIMLHQRWHSNGMSVDDILCHGVECGVKAREMDDIYFR